MADFPTSLPPMPGGAADVASAVNGGVQAMAPQVQPDVNQVVQQVTAQLGPLQSQLDQIRSAGEAIVTQVPIDSGVASAFTDAIDAAKKALTELVMTVVKQAPEPQAQNRPVPMG